MGDDAEKRLTVENSRLRQLLKEAGIDAAEHRVAEHLQNILVEELHHRVKNMLATVNAIVRQSFRSAETPEEAQEAIGNRLRALGRVHELLLKTSWDGAKLADVLTLATEPFETPGAGQFLIQASDIEISPGASLPLAMTLNELSTNAVKYGALSLPQGRVSITAKVDEGASQFRLTWVEKGGPPVKEPSRRSFGTRLIESSFIS
ncbi:sensor histidine kinase [soil metagenome]